MTPERQKEIEDLKPLIRQSLINESAKRGEQISEETIIRDDDEGVIDWMAGLVYEQIEAKDQEIQRLKADLEGTTACMVKAENGWAKLQSVATDLQEFLRKFISAFDAGNSDDFSIRDEAETLLNKKWPPIQFADDAELTSYKAMSAKMAEDLRNVRNAAAEAGELQFLPKVIDKWDETLKSYERLIQTQTS